MFLFRSLSVLVASGGAPLASVPPALGRQTHNFTIRGHFGSRNLVTTLLSPKPSNLKSHGDESDAQEGDEGSEEGRR